MYTIFIINTFLFRGNTAIIIRNYGPIYEIKQNDKIAIAFLSKISSACWKFDTTTQLLASNNNSTPSLITRSVSNNYSTECLCRQFQRSEDCVDDSPKSFNAIENVEEASQEEGLYPQTQSYALS